MNTAKHLVYAKYLSWNWDKEMKIKEEREDTIQRNFQLNYRYDVVISFLFYLIH
jgi:hypothetical protein